jgi:Flp pilus assembly pilin Flp
MLGDAFIRCVGGATAIEYAFIASLVSIAAYAAFGTIGHNLSSIFSSVAASF